jgi:dTDP-4-dehydrorhamnose 3,5-epimerase
VTGLYFYDNDVIDIASRHPTVDPRRARDHGCEPGLPEARRSARRGDEPRHGLARYGHAQLLLDAANFIRVVEERQGLKIACPEEVAFRKGYIDADALAALAAPLMKSGYGEYLTACCARREQCAMQFDATPLPGVYLLTPRVFGDERGFFMESWNAACFAKPASTSISSRTITAVRPAASLRGLHYQTRHTQGKLVRVSSGRVFDVAVDLRRDSPTLGKSYGVILDDREHRMLWIPPGFAHGFYVLSEFADFQYKCTDRYDPDSESQHCLGRPELAIDWPLVGGAVPVPAGPVRQGCRGPAFLRRPAPALIPGAGRRR